MKKNALICNPKIIFIRNTDKSRVLYPLKFPLKLETINSFHSQLSLFITITHCTYSAQKA